MASVDPKSVLIKDRKITKEILATAETFDMLFPDGAIPDRDSFLEYVRANRDNLTVRESWLAFLWGEGWNLKHGKSGITLPDMAGDQAYSLGQKITTTFAQGNTQGPIPESLRDQVKATKDWLDKPLADYLKANSGKKFADINNKFVGKNNKIDKFVTYGPVAFSKGEVKFSKVLSDESIVNMFKAYSDIPDDDIREALFVGSFGARGEATVNIAVNERIAEAAGQSDMYWDPETQTLYATETGTKKGLPPTRTVDPVTAEILNRRWKEATATGATRLFPDKVTSKALSDALKQYVYPQITEADQIRIGKTPAGILDLRKLMGSWMLATMGQGDLIDQLLSHSGGPIGDDVLDKAARISKVGLNHYFTTETEPRIFGDFSNKIVQHVAKLAGFNSFGEFSKGGMGLNKTFKGNDVPFFDFDETDPATESAETKVVRAAEQTGKDTETVTREMTPEEIEAYSAENVARSQNRSADLNLSTSQKQLEAAKNKQEALGIEKANLATEQEIANAPAPERIPGVSDEAAGKLQATKSRLAKKRALQAAAALAGTVPIVGKGAEVGLLGLDIAEREEQASQEIQEGASPAMAYGKQAASFVAGAVYPPYGIAEALGPSVEAQTQELLTEQEKLDLKTEEGQEELMRGMGQFASQIRGY